MPRRGSFSQASRALSTIRSLLGRVPLLGEVSLRRGGLRPRLARARSALDRRAARPVHTYQRRPGAPRPPRSLSPESLRGVTELLDSPPYGPRQDQRLLAELNALARHHRDYCPPFARIWKRWTEAADVSGIPFLHVGLFKLGTFQTDYPSVRRGRTLRSSGTSGSASQIALDDESASLQSRSAA